MILQHLPTIQKCPTRQKTDTPNIRDIQQLLQHENKRPINRDDIAKALEKRNLLKHIKTKQISSNIKFVSIEFHNKDIMETFCLERLQVKSYNIQFLPDHRKSKHNQKKFIKVSLLNVPVERTDEPLTEFLEQFADIE